MATLASGKSIPTSPTLLIRTTFQSSSKTLKNYSIFSLSYSETSPQIYGYPKSLANSINISIVSIKINILSPLFLWTSIRYYKTINLFGFPVCKYIPIVLPYNFLLSYSFLKIKGISTLISTHYTFARKPYFVNSIQLSSYNFGPI